MRVSLEIVYTGESVAFVSPLEISEFGVSRRRDAQTSLGARLGKSSHKNTGW